MKNGCLFQLFWANHGTIKEMRKENENGAIINETIQLTDDLDLSNKKILIVDDNKLNLKVASKILSRYNWKVANNQWD